MITLIAALGCGEKQEAPAVEEVKLVRLMTLTSLGPILGKSFPGQVKAIQTAALAFRVAGPLVEFPVTEGQEVRQGDLLARIDPRDFQTALAGVSGSLEEARFQLEAMRAGARAEDIRVLEAGLEARGAELTEVEQRHARFKKLLEDGVIAQQEYDGVKAEYDVALSNVETAKQELEVGRQGARQEDVDAQESRIRTLEAQYREAQNALKDAELRAPFDGVIARTNVENFEDVQARQPILTIQDLSQVEIEFYISESDMSQSVTGLTIEELAERIDAQATFASQPGRKFDVRLKSYETEADPDTQTFAVTMVMDQPADFRISPGMNATIAGRRTDRGEAVASFLIPIGAVFADSEGGKNVWVVDSETQRVQSRQVAADEMVDDRIRVTAGLQPGEVIAVTAAQSLREGMRVGEMANLGEL